MITLKIIDKINNNNINKAFYLQRKNSQKSNTYKLSQIINFVILINLTSIHIDDPDRNNEKNCFFLCIYFIYTMNHFSVKSNINCKKKI